MSQRNSLCRHSTNGLTIPPLIQSERICEQQLEIIRLKSDYQTPNHIKLRRKDFNKTNEGNTYFHKLRYDVNANRFYKVDVEINLLLNYPFQSSKILVIRLNCLIL